MTNAASVETARWDHVGVAVSGLCLVHCLAGALLPGLFAVAGTHLVSDETLHAGLLLIVLPVAALALARGMRRHGERRVGLLGLCGVASLAIALGWHGGSESTETALTVLGSSMLVGSHAWNARLLALLHSCCS
jgi:hypothetical protein